MKAALKMVPRSDTFTNTCELQLTRFTFQVSLLELEDAPLCARETWRIWKLIPVKVEGVITPPRLLSEALGSGSLSS